MSWVIFAMLLILGLVGFLGSYTLVGGVIQIILICALVAIAINRIARSKVE
jgi:hypothetical protein